MMISESAERTAKSPRWALFKKQFDLKRNTDDKIYLTRWWILKTPWFGVAVHKMCQPDIRNTLHDHPFSFLSVVLRGGYIERRLDPKTYKVDERHVIRRVNRMRKYDAHAITELLGSGPTWTLLFCGNYRRTWGFLERASFEDRGQWIWTQHSYYDSGHST